MAAHDVFGDDGAWTRHLALAWRAVADPGGAEPLPSKPGPLDGDGWDRIAWWSPLLHLVTFGNGWPRPDIGLARWDGLHRPAQDARLAVVERWWAGGVQEAAEWAERSTYFRTFVERVADGTGTRRPSAASAEDLGVRIRDIPGSWGHGDPMHLVDHTIFPVHGDSTLGTLVVGSAPTTANSGRAVLLLDAYCGWYGALHAHGATLPHEPGHRSWRIDVVCRPVGWLGTYRRSRVSGRWFAGRHRWHELGIP